MIDENCAVLEKVRPWALVDAILAKKNLGTTRDMADKTIGLGPGFTAAGMWSWDETMRGHNLGRIIGNGSACPQYRNSRNIGGWGCCGFFQIWGGGGGPGPRDFSLARPLIGGHGGARARPLESSVTGQGEVTRWRLLDRAFGGVY